MSKRTVSFSRKILTGLAPAAALAACLGASSAARAATLNVPTTAYPTIQAGINAAGAGDTVLIADGTYTGAGNVALDFGGKSITVASLNGAAKTIIDLQRHAQGVTFHSGETAVAKLQGLTIENSPPVIANGGAVAMTGSSPTITGCVFLNNLVGGGGGGLYADALSHPVITGCGFIKNVAGSFGGGLYVGGMVTVTGCTFTQNDGNSGGGGAYLAAPGGTGTVAVVVTGSVFTGCTFTQNTASSGGGLSSQGLIGARNLIQSCAFVSNSASAGSGGGFFGVAALTNCTFLANSTSTTGAAAAFAVDGEPSSSSSVTNCILFDAGGNEIELGNNGNNINTVPVTYSDVFGGYPGTGNVSYVPGFVNGLADQHLKTSSPLVRAGTSQGAPLRAQDGAVRPTPPSIGAYEVGPAVLPAVADSYVLSSAPAQNFGTAPALTVGGFLGAAFLQFDLTSLSPLTAGSTARLHLNAGRPLAGTASLVLSAAGTNWTEAGLTFSNRPAFGLPLGFLDITADGLTAAPYDVDVTPYVKAQQALGNTQIGLALTQFGFGLPVTIDSKENPAGDGPQLLVTY